MSSLKEFRKSVCDAITKYEELFPNRVDDDGNVRHWEASEIQQIAEKIIGYQASETYGGMFNPRYTLTGLLPKQFLMDNSVDDIKATVDWIEENPLQFKVWLAYNNAIERDTTRYYNSSVRWNKIILTNEDIRSDITIEDTPDNDFRNFAYHQLLVRMATIEITKEDLIVATAQAKRILVDKKDTIKRYGTNMGINPKPNGIAKVFENSPRISNTTVNQQLQTLIAKMPSNGLAARTWGFEIEVPDAKGVDVVNQSGIEKGEDGSLRSYNSDNCECSCSSCAYHECNCDHCEDYNDSPDHDCGYSECSQADMAEFRTTGGIQRLRHSGMYDLLRKLNDEDAEKNDSAGTHIHVWAQDLTTHQVGQVMAIYKFTESIMTGIAGRFNVNYAGEVRLDHISRALKRSGPTLTPVKPVAVNVTHIVSGDGRGTIEFRQMDCNLDADRITFWAWLVRGLVEVAKRGAKLQNFLEVKDLIDVVDVLGKFKYELGNENPGETIPGSRVDKYLLNKDLQKHMQAS